MTTPIIMGIVLIIYIGTCVYQFRKLNRDDDDKHISNPL